MSSLLRRRQYCNANNKRVGSLITIFSRCPGLFTWVVMVAIGTNASATVATGVNNRGRVEEKQSMNYQDILCWLYSQNIHVYLAENLSVSGNYEERCPTQTSWNEPALLVKYSDFIVGRVREQRRSCNTTLTTWSHTFTERIGQCLLQEIKIKV